MNKDKKVYELEIHPCISIPDLWDQLPPYHRPWAQNTGPRKPRATSRRKGSRTLMPTCRYLGRI